MALPKNPVEPEYILEMIMARKEWPMQSPWLSQARQFCEARDWEQAQKRLYQVLEQAEALSTSKREQGDPIKACVYMCLAVSFIGENKLGRAKEYLGRALQLFAKNNDCYGQALALFSIGLVLHREQDWVKAPVTYQQSLDLLEGAKEDAPTASLRKKIEDWQDRVFEDSQEGKKPRKTAGIGFALDLVQMCPDVSAGEGIWAEMIDASVQVKYVWINKECYQIAKVKGAYSTRLKLLSDTEYRASLVRGNSMNQLDIEDGDYVIFQKPRNTPFCPEEGDIVVTAIQGELADSVVVKEYHVAGGQIWLRPKSDDPDFQKPKRYDPRRVTMIGKVTAVLKRTYAGESILEES